PPEVSSQPAQVLTYVIAPTITIETKAHNPSKKVAPGSQRRIPAVLRALASHQTVSSPKTATKASPESFTETATHNSTPATIRQGRKPNHRPQVSVLRQSVRPVAVADEALNCSYRVASSTARRRRPQLLSATRAQKAASTNSVKEISQSPTRDMTMW